MNVRCSDFLSFQFLEVNGMMHIESACSQKDLVFFPQKFFSKKKFAILFKN